MTGSNSILAKMAVILTANNAEFNKVMKDSARQFGALDATIKSTRAALTQAFGGYTLYRGIESGIRTLAQFEKQMDTVAAITGATGGELALLEQNAKQLGKSTEYTAGQVGQLQTEYGRLGFSTQEILDVTKATIDLATATGEDLAKSADIAGSTIRGFNLDASKATHVTDLMASSFNKSALGLENFGEAMKYASSSAYTANVTLEETTAMMAVLADAGLRGSIAGTSLRRIMTLIAKDGRDVNERLEELAKTGISVSDAYDEVGLTAQNALMILTRNNERVKELTQTFKDANGETARMSEIMRDNLSGDWDKFTSAIEGAALQGQGLASVLREIVQLMTILAGGGSVSAGPSIEAIPFIGPMLSDNPSEWDKKMANWDNRIKDWEERYRKTWDLFNATQNISSGNKGPTSLTPQQENALLHKSVLAQDKTPMSETVFQMQEYEAALIKGLAAQEQFDASNVKLSQSFEQATKSAANHLEVLNDEETWKSIRANMKATEEQVTASVTNMANIYMMFADAIADAAAMSIESGESFVHNLVKQTDQVVQQLMRRAMAEAAYAAFNDPTVPGVWAKLAAMTVAMVGVRAAFAGISKATAPTPTPSSSTIGLSRRDYSENNHVTFRIRGQELQGTLDNYSQYKSRMGT